MASTIDVLKADPLKFLKVFQIKLATSKASRCEQVVHYGKKGNDLRFDTAFPNVDDPSKAEICKSHVVQAAHGAPNFYQLTDECNLMLTSQLSGCCMILDKSGQMPKIAHVWPHTSMCQCTNKDLPFETGAQIQNQLALDYPDCQLYGINDYLQTYSYVIGVKTGDWRFYAQERPNDGRISKAIEIFT